MRIPRLLLPTLVFVLLLPPAAAYAQHPFRGSLRWVVLLCRYSDAPATTLNTAHYDSLFVRPGTGGLADYWASLSRNSVTTNEATVHGWYTIPRTTAQAMAIAGGTGDRNRLFNECVDAARSGGYSVPGGFSIAVVTNPGVDLWGGGGRAFFPLDIELGAYSHEVGHGMGQNHSFSDDPTYRNAVWSEIGEYDDQWDAMSYANEFGTPTARFGSGAAGLNGPYLDRMGWLPRSEVVTFGYDGATSRSYTLRALYGGSGGTRLIRIPFDISDPFHYYTVEFRRPGGWDAGIPGDVVLIHEVKRFRDNYVSYLLRERGGDRNPVQTLNANGVSIRVTGPGTVAISSGFADRCLEGYVWREADSSDHVCVPRDIRQRTRDDNARAAARRDPAGAVGPETCVAGFVWREANPSDRVCVPPSTREATREENRLASTRGNPARLVFGPNTCNPGMRWREADDMDYVCVSPSTRDQTLAENASAASRRDPRGAYGPESCVNPYVWRDAFPGDRVCVTRDSRTRAADDNREAGNRLRQR